MKNFQQLSSVEMKNVMGGKAYYTCYVLTASGGHGAATGVYADNVNQAQAKMDSQAYSDLKTNSFPYGVDCPGATD